MRNALALATFAVLLGACSGSPGPAPLDTRNEACAHCRMAVSDARFAAQVVAPHEEPRFFDDIGCLRAWLLERGGLQRGAAVFVADHRTKAWIRAGAAVFSRVPGLQTPMASHLVAHADAASRERDEDARGGDQVPAAYVLGSGGAP